MANAARDYVFNLNIYVAHKRDFMLLFVVTFLRVAVTAAANRPSNFRACIIHGKNAA